MTQRAKLIAFNSFFEILPFSVVHEDIPVPPGSRNRVRFTYDGGLNYYDAQGRFKSLPPGPKYEVTFATSTPSSGGPEQVARVFGQQMDWDIPCWPNIAVTLGLTTVAETDPYFPVDFPRGWPCRQMTCITEKGTGKIVLQAEHFAATVDMSKMMTSTPLPDDEMVFFAMLTDANTTGKIVITSP